VGVELVFEFFTTVTERASLKAPTGDCPANAPSTGEAPGRPTVPPSGLRKVRSGWPQANEMVRRTISSGERFGLFSSSLRSDRSPTVGRLTPKIGCRRFCRTVRSGWPQANEMVR